MRLARVSPETQNPARLSLILNAHWNKHKDGRFDSVSERRVLTRQNIPIALLSTGPAANKAGRRVISRPRPGRPGRLWRFGNRFCRPQAPAPASIYRHGLARGKWA